MSQTKLVVAIGGTLRDGSSTEAAMRRVLYFAEQRGARTRIFSGATLEFPFYMPGNHSRVASAGYLVESLRAADSIIIGSPGYHGGISGLVKNALDANPGRKPVTLTVEVAAGSVTSDGGDK